MMSLTESKRGIIYSYHIIFFWWGDVDAYKEQKIYRGEEGNGFQDGWSFLVPGELR